MYIIKSTTTEDLVKTRKQTVTLHGVTETFSEAENIMKEHEYSKSDIIATEPRAILYQLKPQCRALLEIEEVVVKDQEYPGAAYIVLEEFDGMIRPARKYAIFQSRKTARNFALLSARQFMRAHNFQKIEEKNNTFTIKDCGVKFFVRAVETIESEIFGYAYEDIWEEDI